MIGAEPQEARVIAAFDGSAFARLLGFRVVGLEDGTVTVSMDGKRSLSPNGTVHGGAIFALADHAFGCAANLAGQEVALAAEIEYVSPAHDGPLTATARRIAETDAVSLYRVEVRQNDRLVALFSGHGFRLGSGATGSNKARP